MRVLVCPDRMDVGGSQRLAVALAGAGRRHGHDPVLYAPDGPLVELAELEGLPRVPAPTSARAWRRGLTTVARLRAADLVHTYERRPAVHAALAIPRGLPRLATVLAMSVPRSLPDHVPLTVGTPALAEHLRARGRRTHLLGPAVDVARLRRTDPEAARVGWGIGADELVVSMVSMLTTDLEKLQGVLEAIRVVDRLADRLPLRLLVAGDGEGRGAVEQRARAVNDRHGRPVVQPVGPLLDPAPVHAAADIVLGMGSAAIAGAAHGRAVVVQCEAGSWRTLGPDTADDLVRDGWFGRGGAGARDLAAALTRLAASAPLRAELGAFGHDLARSHYDLDDRARELSTIYAEVAGDTASRPVRTTARAWSLARAAATGAREAAGNRLGSVVAREERARQGAHP
jgi:glycosyltransferase involved in cell wall biosynthesis